MTSVRGNSHLKFAECLFDHFAEESVPGAAAAAAG